MSLGRTLKAIFILLPILIAQLGEASPRARPKDVSASQGIVLTGGQIQLDFGDAQTGLLAADLNRMDQLLWSGGTGALTGQNLIDEVIDNEGSTEPEDIFGESYGVDGDPQPVGPGYAAVASNQTNTTLTTTTTGTRYGVSDNEPIASTDYMVFPAGDPNENEFRISRTINFTSATPIYQTSAVRVYMPDLPSTYGIVLYPNAAGNIVSMDSSSCAEFCEVTDWNGKWFAEDDDSGTGMVVFRDVATQAPAELVVSYEEESLDNLTSIGVLQPAAGFKTPLTESEWICFYDPSTWTAADQQAGNLPKGCAQMNHAVTPLTPAPSVTIALDTPSVPVGQSAHLTWSTSNATACTASGAWSGSEPSSGTTTETPTVAGSFTYTLTCTGSGGSTTGAAVLTVNAAPSISFSAAASTVKVGQSDTLNWSTTNTTSCAASGAWSGSEGISGSASVAPTAVGTSVYTLSCTGPGGSANASVNLAVVAAAAAVLSGHVGGGGALSWQWLSALAILALVVRGSWGHKHGGNAPRTLATIMTLCVVAAGFTPVRAQQAVEAPQPYVGLRAGQANYQYSPANLENALGAGDGEIDAVTISKKQFGGMLYGGVPIYRSLMLEVSYAQLGQFPLSIKASSSDTAALANRILGQLAPAGHGVTAGFALPLQFGSTFGIEPRISALYYQSKQVVATSSGDYRNDLRGLGIDAGLSLALHVTGPLQLGVGADCMHMTQACNVLLYTGQIEYRFGRHGR